MLLPHAAENYPLKIRGRATDWVAACTKGGGLVAQLLGLLALAPSLLGGAWMVLVPLLAALIVVAWCCAETRGRDLRDFEAEPPRGTDHEFWRSPYKGSETIHPLLLESPLKLQENPHGWRPTCPASTPG